MSSDFEKAEEILRMIDENCNCECHYSPHVVHIKACCNRCGEQKQRTRCF